MVALPSATLGALAAGVWLARRSGTFLAARTLLDANTPTDAAADAPWYKPCMGVAAALRPPALAGLVELPTGCCRAGVPVLLLPGSLPHAGI